MIAGFCGNSLMDGWMDFAILRLQNYFYAEELKIEDSWVGLI
jgi:hypothetical protein